MTEELTVPPGVPTAPQANASAAAQAYKAQIALGLAQPASLPTGSDARTALRKKVTGRARIVLQGGRVALSGKMVDISVNGVCVLLDDMVPVKITCTLECDIFQDGVHRVFSTPAVSVYAVLASTFGFKVGFQFGPRSAAAQKTLAEIMR